jgi:hypothetical protein
MDDLDRLFQRLIQRIREVQPEYLTRPFAISELYQTLVPYRHHRRELQIDTNQDYEAAVIRLLSGERGYLVGDEGMQDFLRTEMASPNPDTAVFREFGSNRVAIAPGVLERFSAEPPLPVHASVDGTPAEEHDTRQPGRPAERATETPVSAAFGAAGSPVRAPAAAIPEAATQPSAIPHPPSMPEAVLPTPARSITAADLGGKCRYCAGALPEGRRIVFCPHCGQNLTVHRCPACSSELEMGWKFCVTCGRSAQPAAT